MGKASNLEHLVCSLKDQSWPPKPTFSVDQIPDLSGKVMIVTGGNAGVGKETVKVLLQKNATVYMASRSRAKAEEAIAELKAETGKEAVYLELDLASLASIKRAAEEFQSKESQLHVLFNNAGVMIPPIDLLTADGYDLQFGTNVLGHFYLTHLLTPILVETAKDTPDHRVRVITTSASAHLVQGLKWDTFVDGPARKKMSALNLYSQSKYGNVVIALELARRLGDQGIVSISLNPGNVRSDLQRNFSKVQLGILKSLFLHPTPYGALTQLWGGTMPETAEYNGKYLIPWARLGEPRADTADPETGKRLWEWCEEQVKNI